MSRPGKASRAASPTWFDIRAGSVQVFAPSGASLYEFPDSTRGRVPDLPTPPALRGVGAHRRSRRSCRPIAAKLFENEGAFAVGKGTPHGPPVACRRAAHAW